MYLRLREKHSKYYFQIILGAFLLIYFSPVYSQNLKTVKFSIVNEENEPIPDVYFQNADNGQYLGVSSDGSFSTQIKTFPIKILITHVSFESQVIELNENSDSKIDVILETKNVNLPTVGITAEIEEVNTKKAENIKDYLFTDKGILMLLASGKRNKLKLISDDGEESKYFSIPDGANSIYKDCRGLIHLIYEDTIRRVEYFLGDLTLTDKISFSDFTTYILPCKITKGDMIIRFIQEEENQANSYLISHEQPPKFKLMRQMFDIKMRRRIDQERALVQGTSSVETNSVLTLGEVRQRQRDYDFFRFIIKKDLYTPLFEKDDRFFIFDHYHDSLVSFDNRGEKLNSYPITYHNSDDFRPFHLQDYTNEDIYVTMRHKRVYTIYKFDFEALNIENPVRISKPFPIGLKVKDGRVYYLARDLTDEHKNYRLFSESLK